jgi:hypothetical protein
MSISTVPYWWPQRSANSSTPGTVTWPTSGSGIARIHRSSLDRLIPIPNLVASREPARPMSARRSMILGGPPHPGRVADLIHPRGTQNQQTNRF